ncbi:MAG: hypothetical protein ACP5OF_01310 [bacterium]
MKKIGTSLITSLIVLGLTVSARAGYIGGTNETSQGGQTYQMRQTTVTLPPIKIGVGFNRQITVASLPVHVQQGEYGLTPDDLSARIYAGDFGAELDLGGNQFASPGGDSSTFDLGLKLFYSVVSKSFVRFNAGLALMYSTYSYPITNNGDYIQVGNGIDIIAGPEFFIPQLPELGFNVEIGFGYHSYSYNNDHFAGDDLGTRGFDFLQAGIHYYF